METLQQEAETQQLSKEELDNRREELTNYYKESIDHLQVQLKYEELLRDIEKTRAERVQAQMFLAQSVAQNNNTEEAAEEPVKKTLKRSK
jgi:hypothetical protein|tara:strand:+ start:57 stop:326 length:270 start_codon:yes stop_codon:yes gene_type:complete